MQSRIFHMRNMVGFPPPRILGFIQDSLVHQGAWEHREHPPQQPKSPDPPQPPHLPAQQAPKFLTLGQPHPAVAANPGKSSSGRSV